MGIDLLCARRCSFDCVFCEVGHTDTLSMARGEFVPTADVIAEIQTWLEDGGTADVITLAGAGEPTLHTRFGDVIDAIHARCAIPVVLLTNSTLLGDAVVRADAARADIVKVSLSAWDDASMRQINRPVDGLPFAALYAGIMAFRAMYRGDLWLEVVLIRGINDRPDQVAHIATLASALNPDKVQLNTVVRPPAVPGITAVPAAELLRFSMLFSPQAEVIALRGEPLEACHAQGAGFADGLLAMLARRPCTVQDIARVCGMDEAQAARQMQALVTRGAVQGTMRGDRCYYSSMPGRR